MSLHLQYNSKNHQVDLIANSKGGIDIKINHKIVANFLEEELFDFTRDIILACTRKEKDLLGSGLRRRQLEFIIGRSAITEIINQDLL